MTRPAGLARASVLLWLVFAAACGKDDRFQVDLVFPDDVSAQKAKRVAFEIRHNPSGAANCLAKNGEPIVSKTTDWPPPPGPLTQAQLPEAQLAFWASVSDGVALSPYLGGCTEARVTRGRDLEVLIVLSP